MTNGALNQPCRVRNPAKNPHIHTWFQGVGGGGGPLGPTGKVRKLKGEMGKVPQLKGERGAARKCEGKERMRGKENTNMERD